MSAFISIPHDNIGRTETPSLPIRRRLMARVVATYATWLARRAERYALARLAAMDDRMLADIGLTRTQIGFAVRFGRR